MSEALKAPIWLTLIIFAVVFLVAAYRDRRQKRIWKEIQATNESFVEACGNTERPKYKCPHCGSRKNSFYASDSDMGHGPSFNVYKCECGRYFDEPPSKKNDVGLRRD